MSGITGWVDWNRDLRTERATLRAMTGTLARRGPDAEEVWLSPRAALGHRRLAVIDAPGGAQPMAVPIGAEPAAVVAFDGQLYNAGELRTALIAAGHQLRTCSDTEVLAHAYLEWGERFGTRLNGMFAVAVWDTAKQELLLVRDRLGGKPLYYTDYGTGLLFGSEPKAIIANPLFTPELDDEGIAEIFAMPGAPTPGFGTYRGMRAVRPGTMVRLSRAGSARVSRYWQLPSREHTDDVAATAGRVRELLEDIVARQLESDVPLGVLLSDGLASAALTALAANAFDRKGRGKLSAFSPVSPESGEHLGRVADQLGTVHLPFAMSTDDLAGAGSVALRARDLPSWGASDLWMYLLARGISRHTTVALSADSADEVFGVYRFHSRPEARTADTFPWLVWNRLGPAGLLKPEVRAQIRLEEYLADRYTQARAEVPRLAGERGQAAHLREVSYLVLTRWLPTLLDRVDRMGMAASLQLRLPYCDHRLVEYLWNVPWEMKNTGGIQKGLLRKAVADLLPEEVVYRQKSAYPTCQDRSYDRALAAWMRELVSDVDAPVLQLVDRGVLCSMLDNGTEIPGPWMSGMAYLLYVNEWLATYRVRIR
jgi:asparagine synthase (glutamine-hydrolysing)